MPSPVPAAAGRPLCILIAALGGEGGGVLADWIVTAALAMGHAVQASSIPGVAQRTGATTYYVELSRIPAPRTAATMTLAPVPGQVDVVVASELLEAGRALLNGFVDPALTTLVASTHRVYTVAEKMQMGDGRCDDAKILSAAGKLARRALLLDMNSLARESGAMVNAVLFGALAGSGAVPLSRSACEQAIRDGGKGIEASLRGFALGYERAASPAPDAVLPRDARDIVALGAARARDFQDARYEALYLERVEAIRSVDGGDFRLTRETARFLALWMCYEDVIRVADLKSRARRLSRVREEVRAKPHEPVHLVEYFKPRLEEIAAILPTWLARRLLAAFGASAAASGFGLHLRTTSVSGFLALRLLAALRPLRRRSSRFAEEQVLVERWLAAIRKAPAALAMEIALCGRLIKGYGDTHQRGRGNFLRILEALVEPGTGTPEAVREACEAALADAGGRKLEIALASHGIEPRPPKSQPIRFIRRPTEQTA